MAVLIFAQQHNKVCKLCLEIQNLNQFKKQSCSDDEFENAISQIRIRNMNRRKNIKNMRTLLHRFVYTD